MENITSDEPHEDFTTFVEYKAGVIIWKTVSPILILLGTIGNCLSIFVLTRRAIRSSTTALYLTLLSFSDLLVLYSGLLRQWLKFLFNKDLRHINELGCKVNIWLVYSSLDLSAWILIAVTVERVISAWLPHKARSLCTRTRAAAFLITIGVFIFSLNSHLLYGMVFKYSYSNDGQVELNKCVEVDAKYTHFFNKVWPLIDLCAFCVVPFVVIVIGNSLILFKVFKSQKKAKLRILPTVQLGTPTNAPCAHAGPKHSSMTAMLFTLNVVFLLSTSPVSIYNIGYSYWVKNANAHEYAKLDLWWAVVNMMMYTNNSVNFLLYCLSGTRFRREVIRIFSFIKGENKDTRMAHSDYTRTRFDTPSPSRSPRHSGSPLTVHAPTSTNGSSLNIFLNNRGNNVNDKDNKEHVDSANCGQSLHPNDAFKISKQANAHLPNHTDLETVIDKKEATDSKV